MVAELNSGNDSIEYKVLNQLFIENIGVNNETAYHYADKSLKVALKLGDSLKIAESFHARGDMRMEMGDVRSGIIDMKIALAISQRNAFKRREMYLLNNLALAYTLTANYDAALEYNFKTLRIREEENDRKAMSISYNNIGLVYLEINSYENAVTYFQRSLDLARESGDLTGIEIALTNIGYCHSGLGDFNKAVESYKAAFAACEGSCSKETLILIHDALGKGYIALEQLKLAENELSKSIALAREINSSRYEAKGLRSLAEIRFRENMVDDAITLLEKSQDIAMRTDLKIELLENYELYTKIYEAKNNYEKISEFQKKYLQLNKSIFNGDLIKNISRIQTEYEEHENLKTIAAKDQVLTLQQDIIARQKSQYAFIITITFLSIGLALVMYRANQFQRKANQQLAVAKETIQNQNLVLEQQVKERTKELFESNESLSKANDELDNFIYKTSHDIRGPLASLKGMCNVAMLDVKDKLALQYLEKLDTSAAKLNAILSRLLIINQINHSLLSPAYLNIEEQIQEILELEKKKGVPERMQISYEVQKGLSFRSDREMAKIILENLIDNAIKFHNESERVQPFVRIKVVEENNWIVVKVTDNGIGIRNESKEQIFHLFVRASERSDTGGIGLYLSKLATLKLGGAIQLSTTSEGYTEFTVRFPKDLVPIIEARASEHLKLPKDKQINLNRS